VKRNDHDQTKSLPALRPARESSARVGTTFSSGCTTWHPIAPDCSSINFDRNCNPRIQRYKALLVDASGNGYLKTVCDYVHLNPARAGIIKPEEPLQAYPWSSYPL
jgi:hypothetical protein